MENLLAAAPERGVSTVVRPHDKQIFDSSCCVGRSLSMGLRTLIADVLDGTIGWL